MFQTIKGYRYRVDQEDIRLSIIQRQKVLVLEIAADYIESARTKQDRDSAIEKLEAIRAYIMELFAEHIMKTRV